MAPLLALSLAPSSCLPRSCWFKPMATKMLAVGRRPIRSVSGGRTSQACGGIGADACMMGRHSSQRRAVQACASGQEADAVMTAAEQRVRAAAALVADTFLRDEITVGVGSGLGVTYLLEELAQRLNNGKLRGVRCVPANDAAASEAAFHGVPLTTLQAHPKLDLFVEVADELAADSEGCLAFIIGRQQQPAQPQLHRARELAAAATTCVVIAEDTGVLVPRLGGSLPVAVQEEGWEDAGEELDDMFLGDAELWRRSNQEGAGPRGGDDPYVSPEGHALIDIRFYEGLKLLGEDADYYKIAAEVESVEGVVAHGLMANVAAAAVVAAPDRPRLIWRGDDLSKSH